VSDSRECPFCGPHDKGFRHWVSRAGTPHVECLSCGQIATLSHWNSRPVEGRLTDLLVRVVNEYDDWFNGVRNRETKEEVVSAIRAEPRVVENMKKGERT